jgi:hypothetical protein
MVNPDGKEGAPRGYLEKVKPIVTPIAASIAR